MLSAALPRLLWLGAAHKAIKLDKTRLPCFFSRTTGYTSSTTTYFHGTTHHYPQHTDPATKSKEKKNEETVKDKPDGKKKTTQQK
ncbi:hypothetical protein [Hymenobacter volaticus]|uniref:Secreted protein n=1 Tax=Hymenobacter volaticus TaxID=2932254 RepID=A0ABY4G6Q0_9BACT|nr:hypothetical protein [Hymenobacter volaticus]UOQ66561.1 hypothetical protein MUN86_01110 [Hymenobacter volaticus]